MSQTQKRLKADRAKRNVQVTPAPAPSRRAPDDLLKKVWPPMLAKLVPSSTILEDKYVQEVKYDGYRGLAAVSGGALGFITRNGLDLSSRFSAIASALSKVKVAEAVIDGEVTAFDSKGISRFQLLMTPEARQAYQAFDLLWLDGEDLRNRPLEERRDLLEKVLARRKPPVDLAERLGGTVAQSLEEAKRRGLEGIIAKRVGSPYVGGRSSEWLKMKIAQSQEVVIVGYLPISTGANEIGALLVATYDGGGFRFAGKVGTGFTHSVREGLWKRLEKERAAEATAIDPPKEKGVVWVKPRYVAQVTFTEWTRDGRMRHPVFQGLRVDKKPEETAREISEVPAKSVSNRDGREAAQLGSERAKQEPAVQLTHPDRILFPRTGLTKRDVFQYYREISPYMLPALKDRPIAFEQWPKGITHPGIFRQHARGVPPWATTATVSHARGPAEHLVVDRPETLLWLANQSALSLHIGAARISRIQEPNWVLLDLDPPGDQRWNELIQLAQSLHGFLDKLGLMSVPKTSGKRGLHILVPLGPGHRHEDALRFAIAIAQALERGLPSIATTERSPAQRKGRIYVDALQNGYGKMMIAPYSLRAVEGASASTPLRWEEVTPKLDPREFNSRTLPKRLEGVGDLFAPVLKGSQRLPEIERSAR